MTVQESAALAGALGIPAAVGSAVTLWFSRRLRRSEARAETRREESRLMLLGLLRLGSLGWETARAVRDGVDSCSMSAAMEEYAQYRDELNRYLLEQNARQNHG